MKRRWLVLCDFQDGSPVPVSSHRWEFTALLSAVIRNRLHPQLDLAYIVGRESAPAPEPRTHPGETWYWPTECTHCGRSVGPWNPDRIGSAMTHIFGDGGPDWETNRDHEPPVGGPERGATDAATNPGDGA